MGNDSKYTPQNDGQVNNVCRLQSYMYSVDSNNLDCNNPGKTMLDHGNKYTTDPLKLKTYTA